MSTTDGLGELEDYSYMITLHEGNLEQCSHNKSLISPDLDKYIRDTEEKLVEYFARALYHKSERLPRNLSPEARAKADSIASLELWLKILNVDPNISEVLRNNLQGRSLQDVVLLSDADLESVCNRSHLYGDDRKRFLKATKNLAYMTRRMLKFRSEEVVIELGFDLSWSTNGNYTPRSPNPMGHRHQGSESGVESDSGLGSNVSQNSLPTTTPPASPCCTVSSASNGGAGIMSSSTHGYLSLNIGGAGAPAYHGNAELLPPGAKGAATCPSAFNFSQNTGGTSARGSVGPVLQTGGAVRSTPRGYLRSKTSDIQHRPRTPPPMLKFGTMESIPTPGGAAHGSVSSADESMVTAPGSGHGSTSSGTGLPMVNVHAPVTIQRSRSHESQLAHRIGGGSGATGGGAPAGSCSSAGGASSGSRRGGSTSSATASPKLNRFSTGSSQRSGGRGGRGDSLSSVPASMCASPAVDAVFADGPILATVQPAVVPTDYLSPTDSRSVFSGQPAHKTPPSPIQGTMRMDIPHRWEPKRKFLKECQSCNRQLTFKYFYKCSDCKMCVCRECKDQRLNMNNCGVPKEFFQQVYQYISNTESPHIMTPAPGSSEPIRARSGSEAAALQKQRSAAADADPARNARKPSDPSGQQSIDLKGSVSEFAIGSTSTASVGHPQPGGSGVARGQFLRYWPAAPGAGDVSSSSSCASSAPSTPAVPGASPGYRKGYGTSFALPPSDTVPEVPDINIENSEAAAISDTIISTDSDNTLVSSGPRQTDSSGTVTTVSTVDSQDAAAPPPDKWRRDKWTTLREKRTNWEEWNVDLSEILGLDSPSALIGRGQFGYVKQGYWHQDVAVKFLSMDHVDTSQQLEAFKREVFSFRNTRHENLILFMGYVITPPQLGIVMNFCKGSTLHGLLHVTREPVEIDRAIHIAIQICVGMSYLHEKRILHKDLRSKNIFVEKGDKVVITDFGIFSVRRLCSHSVMAGKNDLRYFRVPTNWLCYLPPELMRRLGAVDPDSGKLADLAFSAASDIYAFGTIWYELLFRDMPFRELAYDLVIWKVGNGVKPPCSFTEPREMKEIMMQCWSTKPSERSSFESIHRCLEKLPKRRLSRSPSQPVHMSRSAESVF